MNLIDKNILFHLGEEHQEKIQFSRIFLSTASPSNETKKNIFNEIFYLLFNCHQTKVDTVYATRTQNKQIYLITLQFQDQSLSNIMIDFTNSPGQHIKKIEIVSEYSIYDFDTCKEDAFYSDYILNGDYQPNYEPNNPYSNQIEQLLKAVNTSITKHIYLSLDGNGGA